MCFGDQKTGSSTTDSTANPAVSSAATQNLSFAQGLQNKGATPYGGQMVANFSPQQSQSFGMADSIGASPDLGTAGGYIQNAATAGPGSVNANTISSAMDPYMNKYVSDALAPQLQQMQQQFDTQNKGAASNATMAGAFGNDSQDALFRSNLTQQQNIGRQGLIGNAYNAAFNTAIGAGAQDVANNLGAQTTNQNLREAQLQRQAAGATGLEGLSQAKQGVAGFVNQMGQQQTAQNQAGLNANYQEFLRQQQYPFLSTELMNQTIGAGAQAMPASQTTTKYAPDNSGMQALGSFAGPALQFAMMSDEREKENIHQIGRLRDGTPVKAFNYKRDPKKRQIIGLIAQEVEARNPAAVREIGGIKHIIPDLALGPARMLEEQLGIAA